MQKESLIIWEFAIKCLISYQLTYFFFHDKYIDESVFYQKLDQKLPRILQRIIYHSRGGWRIEKMRYLR